MELWIQEKEPAGRVSTYFFLFKYRILQIFNRGIVIKNY